MHSKKRILGNPRPMGPQDKQGVWDLTQIRHMREDRVDHPYDFSDRIPENWPYPDDSPDPFASQVTCHIVSDETRTTHILRDQSGNNWDEYSKWRNYYQDGGVMKRGPRNYHSIDFHSNYYTVQNYTDIQLGSGAFTIEFWINYMHWHNSERYVMAKGAGSYRTSGGTGWTVYITNTHYLGFYDGPTNTSIQCASVLPRDTWTHVAIVREGTGANQLKIYLNGTLSNLGTSSSDFNDTSNMIIGRDRGGNAGTNAWFGGALCDMRISDTARYTDTFSAPTTPIDMSDANTMFSLSAKVPYHMTTQGLHPQGAVITKSDERVGLWSYTPYQNKDPDAEWGHGYVSYGLTHSDTNRSGMEINDQYHPSKDFKFGLNPFTIEMWVYNQDYGRHLGFIGKGSGNRATAGSTGWSFGTDTNGELMWCDGATNLVNNSASEQYRIQTNSWNHVCAVREGTGTNQFKMYLNGRLMYTGTLSTNYTQTESLRITCDRSGQYSGNYFTHYSCMRISDNARYTDQFDINRDTFFEEMMTPDSNALLIMGSLGGNRKFDISVTNNASTAYTLSNDVSGDNAGITANVGDTLNFTVSASGHPFWIKTALESGNTSPVTANITNNGTESGTIQWLTEGAAAGTYYYVCGNHVGMAGTITLSEKNHYKKLTWPTNSYSTDGWEKNWAYARGTHHRVGGSLAIRPNGYSNSVREGNQYCLYAKTSLGDFNFGTGDFSIEFWWNNSYDHDNYASIRMLFDGRSAWADSGIALRFHQNTALYLIADGEVKISAKWHKTGVDTWHHYCVQRVSNRLGLYVDGIKIGECYANDSISCPGNDIVFGNGGYSALNYTSHAYGYLADVRILKGSAAYGNGTLPDRFAVPRTQLTAITDCVLLTGSQHEVSDRSGRNNEVYCGNRYENYTSSWGHQIGYSPYAHTEYSQDTHLHGDQSDQNSGFQLKSAVFYRYADTWPELSWLMHMTKAWTVEFWFRAHVTNPASIGTMTLFQCGNANGDTGFDLIHHHNGAANNWNGFCFRWWASGVANEYIGVNGDSSNMHGHCWNHIAVVYDPTAVQKIGLHINGKRVATRAAFSAAQKKITDQGSNQQAEASNLRISDTARYDNDSTTYSVPTAPWTVDQYTAIQTSHDLIFPDRCGGMQIHDYGVWPCYTFSKWGSHSMMFQNQNSIDTTSYQAYNLYHGYWAHRALSPRRGDITIECWASWWDAASGGKGFGSTAPGSCLFHYANNVWVGIDTSGNWYAYRGDSNTVNIGISTSVAVASRANSTWDHVCIMRTAGDWRFYVNGVYQGMWPASNQGGYAGQGMAVTNYDDDYNNSELKLGTNWNRDFAESWCGFVEDFRVTLEQRYETVNINGVNTMCHFGTKIPALPTAKFPRI